ncbi:MAG: DNA polymerase III subunit delta [Ktedonobacterales bacterium]
MFVLLHGPDEFSAREELARLRGAEDFGYNQDTLSGADADLVALRALSDTMPFLSERRLVVLDGLPKRKRSAKGEKDNGEDGADGEEEASDASPTDTKGSQGKKGKKGKAAGPGPAAFAQGLAEYVAGMPETTVLVALTDEVLKDDHPLVVAARRNGKVQAFSPPRGPQLENWLTRRASAQGVKLTPEAARLLAAEVGENLRLLASEIDKLSTYAGRGGQIRVEDVRLLTPASRQTRIFDLTDALARRERSRALALLHELLAAGESPLGIVALTAYQTRTLLQVKSLAERGMRALQIAQTAGMAPFVVEKSLGLARQLSFAQLEAAHRALLDVDTALKRSRMTPEMALDLLVVEFGTAVR